jgi:hypothetical protein
MAKRSSGKTTPDACSHVRPSSASSAAQLFALPGPPSITRCSTSQLSKPRPQAQTSTTMRSFCTSAPAVRKRAPAGTVPAGQLSRRPSTACQSGASPLSCQVSPSTPFLKLRIASSEPCAASQSRAIRSHDSQPKGE